MEVTVIIPCYNYAMFLEEAVASVRAQTYSHWKCLIIDDGSTDDTRTIAESLCKVEPRVFYYHKSNGGLSSTRNYGIERADTPYVCFLDADDLFDPMKLEEQVNCFKQQPEADIVYGDAKFFESEEKSSFYDNKAKKDGNHFARYTGEGYQLLASLVRENITVISAPLLKKKVFDVVGVFDESYRSYEDWHFWIRCALKNLNFYFCDKPQVCTYIRFGHESMMSDKKKLLRAGIQLRRFLQPQLSGSCARYNHYRLLRAQLKMKLLQ